MNSEVIIVKNPFFYRHLSPNELAEPTDAGAWIPLVFRAVEAVVNRYYFELCELDWDYCRDGGDFDATHDRYKSIYFKNLNDDQRRFVEKIADEIEQEIRDAAQDAAAAKTSDDD